MPSDSPPNTSAAAPGEPSPDDPPDGPSDDFADDSVRAFGPVRIVDASLARRLLGLVVAFVGVQLLAFGTDAFGPAKIEVASGLFHVAIGTFAIANGLYLGGVRPR